MDDVHVYESWATEIEKLIIGETKLDYRVAANGRCVTIHLPRGRVWTILAKPDENFSTFSAEDFAKKLIEVFDSY